MGLLDAIHSNITGMFSKTWSGVQQFEVDTGVESGGYDPNAGVTPEGSGGTFPHDPVVNPYADPSKQPDPGIFSTTPSSRQICILPIIITISISIGALLLW
jgi:hypothetical protein